jgi:hypothetical protein
MYYNTDKNGCFIVKRHSIILLWDFLKFILSIVFLCILYWVYISYKQVFVWNLSSIKIWVFVFMFVMLNYIFFKHIMSLINYYNNLIVVHNDKISIIKCSLILQDDIEAINPLNIMKIDVFSHWFFSNILNFWNLVIEQQKDEVRTFHFIPNPKKLLQIIREVRNKGEAKIDNF